MTNALFPRKFWRLDLRTFSANFSELKSLPMFSLFGCMIEPNIIVSCRTIYYSWNALKLIQTTDDRLQSMQTMRNALKLNCKLESSGFFSSMGFNENATGNVLLYTWWSADLLILLNSKSSKHTKTHEQELWFFPCQIFTSRNQAQKDVNNFRWERFKENKRKKKTNTC